MLSLKIGLLPNFIVKNVVNTETDSDRSKDFVRAALTDLDFSRRKTPALSISICKTRSIRMNIGSDINLKGSTLGKYTHSTESYKILSKLKVKTNSNFFGESQKFN